MSTPTQREAWAIRWGIGLLVILTACLFGLVLYSTVQTASSRQDATERAQRTLDRLEVVAATLDRQASELDVHGSEIARLAALLEGQTGEVETIARRLERAASDTEEARAGFRAALSEILRQLDSQVDPFTSRTEPEPEPECSPPQSRRCRDG
jgi:hypothetical protein